MAAFEVRASGPQVESSGRTGAARVLLIGSGITTGWGVHAHSLGLMGCLRRALQDRLGRDVDIEQISAMGATMRQATELLGSRASEPWDVVVVAFGLSDAMRLTPVASWAQSLGRLLATLDGDARADHAVPVLVVGIPATESLGALRALLPFRPVIALHAQRLNAVSAQITERNRRTVFVAMPGMANNVDRPAGSREAYEAWADVIAARTEAWLASAVPDAGAPVLDPQRVQEAAEVLERLARTPAVARSAPKEIRREALPSPIARRSLLKTEGHQLTRVAKSRIAPAEHDLRIAGPDPIRVLLVGGEYSVGFGAATRADALDGALARLLHVQTGRGVIVENRSEQHVRLHQLANSLGPAGAHTFDLVVWTPTFIEAARTLLRSRWVAGIELMLRRIETTSDATVVLMGVPRLLGAQPLAVLGRSRAAQINRLLRRIAGHHEQVLVVEPPAIALHSVEDTDGPSVYRDAAAAILPAVMHVLVRELPSVAVDRPVPV